MAFARMFNGLSRQEKKIVTISASLGIVPNLIKMMADISFAEVAVPLLVLDIGLFTLDELYQNWNDIISCPALANMGVGANFDGPEVDEVDAQGRWIRV